VLLGHLPSRPGNGHTRVVEHHVEAAVALHGLLDEGLHVLGGPHVGSSEEGLASRPADLLRGALTSRGVDVAQAHQGSLGSQRPRRGPPDARRGPRDQRDLPLDSSHLIPPGTAVPASPRTRRCPPPRPPSCATGTAPRAPRSAPLPTAPRGPF